MLFTLSIAVWNAAAFLIPSTAKATIAPTAIAAPAAMALNATPATERSLPIDLPTLPITALAASFATMANTAVLVALAI